MPFIDSGDARIYWEEVGSGDPVLLVMGLGYTLEMWHRTRRALAARFRVLLFDNRGVGRSGAPPGPYSIAQMAGDARTVLDAAGAARAHVFGMSMGSLIAQEMALSYPERVRSLVLGCTACGGPGAALAEPEVADALVSRARLSAEEGVRVMVPYVYDPGTPRERVEEDIAIRLRHYPRREGYLAQLQAALAFTSHDRLASIGIPTLVIHGESDRLVPPGNGVQVAKAITGAELLLLKGASHIFMTDQPRASHEAITSFLDRVGSRAA